MCIESFAVDINATGFSSIRRMPIVALENAGSHAQQLNNKGYVIVNT